jgi:FMN-dependent NADH-azoreductase
MSLFRLDASIRVEGSHSRAIADIVEQEWRNAHPGEPVIRRHAGVDPIPATAWATAAFAGRTPEESRTNEQQAALALAATLTDELIEADALLFAVPLYNFSITSGCRSTSRPGSTWSSPTRAWLRAPSPSWPPSPPSW